MFSNRSNRKYQYAYLLVVSMLFVIVGCMPSPYPSSAFHMAAERGDVAAITLYLDQGLPVDQPDEYGWTPLQYAATSTSPQMDAIQLLISRGADVNKSTTGSTPLYLAAIREHVGIARFLIEKGADVDAAMAQIETAMNERHEKARQTLERAMRPRTAIAPQAASNMGMNAVLQAAIDAHAKKIENADTDEEKLMFTLVFDTGVSEYARQAVRKAAGISFGLLGRYKIPLNFQMTVRVSADEAGFIQALRPIYPQMGEEEIKAYGKSISGCSYDKMNLILIKGKTVTADDPTAAFNALPHELFHQVQNQYGKIYSGSWLAEGTAELFRLIALEEAGLGPVDGRIHYAVEQVKRQKSIPDTYQLASSNNNQFKFLSEQGQPVYQMSLIMVSRLVDGKDFNRVARFYQLLGESGDLDSAFNKTFEMPLNVYLNNANDYFKSLRP